jgi:hypothetical protein
MSKKNNAIQQLFIDAIENGDAVEARRIIDLRAASKKAVVMYKGVFWVGIAIFNLALWAPLPIELNRSFLYFVAFLALIVAVVVPIIGIKKHQVLRELLKVNKEIPKKKTINEKARVYLDQVKNLDRPLLNVEIELLKDSKWAAKPEEDPAKDSVKE